MLLLPTIRRLFVLALAFLPATVLAAPPSGMTQGPSVEGVHEYNLSNGLTILLFPDATKPTTTVDVTYKVGSRMESYGETGMAHLLEHMLFKGTPSIPSVFAELGRRGMQFNGNTSYDRTTYFETFTASPSSLDWVLMMESERMTRSTFSKAELDSEMTVVRNEYESGENKPQSVLWKRMAAVAFDWHNYGKPTIGARSDIENVPFAKLRAFYTEYYQPDNAVLIVAGKFDTDATLAAIAKYFGAIRRPTRVLPKQYTVEPVQDGERIVTVRRVASTQWVGALFHLPQGASPDTTAFEALAEIMTVEPAGRLYKALVEGKKASTVENWMFPLHDAGFVIFWAQVAPGQSIDAARDTMLATLYDVAAHPITEPELARVRIKAQKDFDDTINDPQQMAVALADSIAEGDWRLFFIHRDQWHALKPADVTRVGTEYLKASNLTIGLFEPEAKPDRAPLAAAINVPALVANYKGEPPVAAGEAFDPTPANLESRTQRFTLSSGMNVALLPKKTRGETAEIEIRLDMGDVKSLENSSPTSSLTADMLERGTTKHDRQAFQDALDKLRSKLDISGGGATVTVAGTTVRASVPEVLRLAAEALREPAFPAAEFTQLKSELLTHLEQSRTDPSALARRAAARAGDPYPPQDVRYTPTIDEEIARVRAVDLAAVKAFYAKFYGASHAEMAIVGDFDVATVKPLLEQLFGGFASPMPYTRVPQPFYSTKAAPMTFDTPDKANAAMFGRLSMQLTDQSPDYASLLVANRVLGGDSDSRIFQRVRVKGGFSYAVGTVFRPASIDPNSSLILYAIFAPQNLDNVRNATADEIKRALDSGFTAQEITAAKKAVLEERRITRAQDPAVAGALVSQAFLGRTWAESEKIDREIEAVTPESATAALRKYVIPANIAFAYAGDFAKK
ncbi:MAG TPA: pitrilysin family protein [Casimicrobiaceae bacterium]|nr:pitrilysin family protein [Casimicrobiaceae bacterium]